MQLSKTLVATALCTGLIACAPNQTNNDASNANNSGKQTEMNKTAQHQISGELLYRERIMTPPGSQLIITVEDVSKADAAAEKISQKTVELGRNQLPYQLDLKLDQDSFKPGHRYSLRATIRSSADQLLWTTTTNNPINVEQSQTKLGTIVMQRVASDKAANDSQQNALIGKEWIVEDIDNKGIIDNSKVSLTFSQDGNVAGLASCNNYSAAYEVDDKNLNIKPAASTKKACFAEALMKQENTFLDLLSQVNAYQFDATGALVLTTADGATIKARLQ